MSTKKQDELTPNVDTPVALPPADWTDLNDVPIQFKSLNGARLNLEQSNWIDNRAHELGYWIEGKGGEAVHFVKDFAKAREEFKETHGAYQNVWMEAKIARKYADEAKRDTEVN